MRNPFRKFVKNAMRLTRSGDLQAVTAAIQAALGAQGAMRNPSSPTFDGTDVHPHEMPAAQRRGVDPALPGGFVAGSSGTATAQREYKLYIPPGAGERPLPLVVMLHGCTQNPDDFAKGTGMNEAALTQGFYVLYPAQSRKANPQRCWNWFKHSHQQRGRGEPAILAAMTREMLAQHAIDPQRVYVAGLSAGGAMAAILGSAYPDLYAAVGVHSGLAAGAATDLQGALAAMRGGASVPTGAAHGVPTIVFHGDADSTVHPANGEQVIAACTGIGSSVETHQVRSDSGRECTRRVHVNAVNGGVVAEHWLVHGSPHAWSGGNSQGSYTDSLGPDATAEMLRFFFEHPQQPRQ